MVFVAFIAAPESLCFLVSAYATAQPVNSHPDIWHIAVWADNRQLNTSHDDEIHAFRDQNKVFENVGLFDSSLQ